MKDLLQFLSLQDPNVRYVVLGTLLVSISTAVIGNFAYLRKRALVGDAVAHSVLPGICLAFMLQGSRSLWVLLPGAFISGWLALMSIELINRKSRLKTDIAIALVLSVFYGLGVLLLTFIQQGERGSQSGLQHFLFGQAAAILPGDLSLFAFTGALLCSSVILLYRPFKLMSFDPAFTQAMGWPLRRLEWILSTLTVLAIVTGIQTVGVVLMAALLISPALAARFWTHRLPRMIVLSALFASLASVLGCYVSFRQSHMPTGPWIIVMMSLLAFASMLLAPEKGWLSRRLAQGQHQWKVNAENLLKLLYHSGEQSGDFQIGLTREGIIAKRYFSPLMLRLQLWSLLRGAWLSKEGQHYRLSERGMERGARLARLHRLWELYLTRYLRIAADHVHDDAEAMEHLITPQIEAELEAALDYPERDPHNRDIPR